MTATVREVQASTNGYDGANKVVTVTTCVAGDTLLIAHGGNANPYPAAPTSTAGTLTLLAGATSTNDTERGQLRVYACPVATTGSKTVTFPFNDGIGGGNGDVQGHVIVLAGTAALDGTASTNAGPDGASATHVMATVSPTGADDLLVAFFLAFATAAGANYYTVGASGLTQRAESYDSGFLQLNTFTQTLAAAGSTGTRSITPITTDNRWLSIGIAIQKTIVTGVGASALGALIGAGTGLRTVHGVGAANLGALVGAGTGTVVRPDSGGGTAGGWYGLLDIYREAADDLRDYLSRPPPACPNDGEPLEQGPNGRLHCRFDGWIWEGANH